MRPETNYVQVFAVAVRLMRGDEIWFVDRHRREWYATATELRLVRGDVAEVIVKGYAADIAEEVVRRRAPGAE